MPQWSRQGLGTSRHRDVKNRSIRAGPAREKANDHHTGRGPAQVGVSGHSVFSAADNNKHSPETQAVPRRRQERCAQLHHSTRGRASPLESTEMSAAARQMSGTARPMSVAARWCPGRLFRCPWWLAGVRDGSPDVRDGSSGVRGGLPHVRDGPKCPRRCQTQTVEAPPTSPKGLQNLSEPPDLNLVNTENQG